jgi:predicted nucleic acid-binding protein
MKVYLDACCLSRLTDDQAQVRIRQEAEAVELILGQIRRQSAQWIASDALWDEVRRNPSEERRLECETLMTFVSETVKIDATITRRANQLASIGYGVYDALHLATAESAVADVLLSTDDRFIKAAARGDGNPRVPVRNPVFWLKERWP